VHAPDDLRSTFGDIDIYLFDQLLKGRITRTMRVLDAGCGSGRNLVYLLRNGYDVSAVDTSVDAVTHVRALAAQLAPALDTSNFTAERVEQLSHPDSSFDLVISSAVLHFASGDTQFLQMVREMWRVLRPSGILFARLASTIGIEDRVRRIDGRRHRLPDGTDRFLVDEAMLEELTASLGGAFLEPIKTTNVQRMRAMTTWVIGKP